jgi:fructose-1,6-bisphosphatase II
MIDRNLTISLVRATEAAAIAAGRWIGLGDIAQADKAAAKAMHEEISNIQMDGRIVIGEERRYAETEYLRRGASIGSGDGPQTDLVVDVVEGTSLLVAGQPGTISVVAVAPRGSFVAMPESKYMQKLVVPEQAAAVIGPQSLNAPPAWILGVTAKALGKSVRDLIVYILDRKRHARLIQDVRLTGARVLLRREADLLGALLAALPDTGVDVMMGTGGTPEGIVGALAVRSLGGVFLGRLAPQSQKEKEALLAAGHDLDKVWQAQDLVRAKDTYFATTGVTDSVLLPGVRFDGRRVTTHSLALRGQSDTQRHIRADYIYDRTPATGQP